MKRAIILILTILAILAIVLVVNSFRKKNAAPPIAAPTAAPTGLVETSATVAPTPVDTPEPTAAPPTPTQTATPIVEAAWVCPEQPATVTLWHNWEGARQAALSAALDDYRETCTNIEIDAIVQPDVKTAVVDAVDGDAASDAAGPDVFIEFNRNIAALAEADLIAPLDPFIDRAEFEAQFVGTAAASAADAESIFGLPLAMHTVALIYNADLISPDDLPRNTDALLAKAASWKKTDYYFVYDVTDARFSASWLQAAGVNILKEPGQVTFASNAGYTAGNFVEALRSVIPNRIDRAVADTLFRDKRAPLIIEDLAYLADIQQTDMQIGAAPLPLFSPTKSPAVPFVDVECLMLTPKGLEGENSDAAVNLMQYLARASVQIKLAAEGGILPANKAAAESAEVQNLPGINGFVYQAALGKPAPDDRLMRAVWEPMTQGMTCIWSGSRSVEKCLDEIQATAEKNLAEQPSGD